MAPLWKVEYWVDSMGHYKIIILFNAGDKGTQTKDIELARQRLYQLKPSYSEVVI